MKHYVFLFSLLLAMSPIGLLAIDGKLITTIDYALEDKWYNTISSSTPMISTVGSVFQEQYFFISPLISDYATDKNSMAKITYDIIVTDPNNKVYFSQKNVPALNVKVSNPQYVMLSQAMLKVNLEKDKPLGAYRIDLTVKDAIGNTSKQLTQSIEVKKYLHENHFSNDEQFQEWLGKYYIAPSPEKLVDAYLYYSKSKLNESNSGFPPVFTFFLTNFNNNKYLLPYMVDMFREQDLKTRIYLVYLFRYVNHDLKPFLNKLTGKDREVYNGIKNRQYAKNPYEKIDSGEQLDMLWGEFLATGAIRPINRLIDTLNYKEPLGSLDAYKNIKNPTDADRKKAMYDVVYKAAVWSLKSNCKQHALVKDYCTHILQNRKLTDNVRVSLQYVLSE